MQNKNKKGSLLLQYDIKKGKTCQVRNNKRIFYLFIYSNNLLSIPIILVDLKVLS